jgi:predicted ester cyclase
MGDSMGAMPDLEELNKSVVRRLGEALNGHRLDLLDDLVAADFVRHCQATPSVQVRSLEDFKRFLQDDWAGAPDAQSTVQFLIAEGDFVALYWTYAGTQTGPWGPLASSGRAFDLDVSGIFRLAGGKVAELWVTWDNLTVLRQLGHAPPAAG